MHIGPTVYTGRPSDQRIPQEEAIYDKLEELSIPFTRVDHDHADTMEDCLRIESVLGGKICKNLFLCNRQQTEFYLLMMPGDKPFKTKYLSAQLGCSRLSFADAGHMEEYLHTIPGSVSALELLFDAQGKVQLVIDRPLLADDTISGHPGMSTSTLRMRREDLLNYVEAVGHGPIYVDLPDPRETGEAGPRPQMRGPAPKEYKNTSRSGPQPSRDVSLFRFNYSRMIPDASQAAMVSSSHRDTCTSPMWALCPSGQGRMGSRTDLNARAK